jgi:CrcB protein
MNQVIAVALGGAFGAVFRFLISTGVYQWLGKSFPDGTLAVNVTGSLLIGLMTEALLLQRIALSMEYRSAILVGLFGSLTTFSTFSLDTLYLLEQGQIAKAAINIFVSVFVCIFAVWIGLTLGRGLFSNSAGVIRWQDWHLPYGLVIVSTIGAFFIALFSILLIDKNDLSMEYNVALVIVLVGVFITFSSLYIVLHFIEHGHSFDSHLKSISVAVSGNIILCSFSFWLGLLAAKQI